MTHSSTERLSDAEIRDSLAVVEVKPGVKFSLGVLKALLPDVETLLFFGKVYELDYAQLSNLMAQVLQSKLANELFRGSHSEDLQSYLIEDMGYDLDQVPHHTKGDVTFSPTVPKGEILPELWKSLEVEVADSIKAVAKKLQSIVGMMPGKTGELAFKSMLTMNKQRPGVLGDHRAQVHHAPQKPNLVIVDDSGSVTIDTVRAIIGDCIALSYLANAHFALVSSTCRTWEPGTYDVPSVSREFEGGGTQYETLEHLLQKDWGVVVCIADYDSSASAKEHIAAHCKGSIDVCYDVSLVQKPTFLAECVGQLAGEIRPMLVAAPQTRFVSSWAY